MKKIIRISNEPSFNKGVESYVIELDLGKKSYSVSPNIENAKCFNDDIRLNESVYYIKERFPKATVKIIEINEIDI
jgi:hypothetical protein